MLVLGAAFLAGILASLSPCVLPILPLVLGAALNQHRLGPAALAAGLAVSFAGLGILLATAGFALGIGAEPIRRIGALLMIGFGVVLLLPRLQLAFATTSAGIMAPVQGLADRVAPQGPWGQLGLGALLGVVWAPCTGPALGSAFTLATQAGTAGWAATIMTVFAIGAALPLLVLGYAARSSLARLKQGAAAAAGWLKPTMGALLALFGLLVLTGTDKALETAVLNRLPDWWVLLTVRF